MLQLHKDLVSRLILSAQKNRVLNAPFKVIHVDAWSEYSYKESEETRQKIESLSLRSVNSDTVKNTSSSISKSEKIDEKVDKIINDPAISEIKAELIFAEMLLQKIKSMDEHNLKIPAIEETIIRLKILLEQKNYV